MADDDLQMILRLEAEARRQVDAARHEAEHMVAEAEDGARRTVREARDTRDELASVEEAQRLAAAEEKARRIAEGARTRIAAMQVQARSRMEQAVASVVQYVLSDDAPTAGGPHET